MIFTDYAMPLLPTRRVSAAFRRLPQRNHVLDDEAEGKWRRQCAAQQRREVRQVRERKQRSVRAQSVWRRGGAERDTREREALCAAQRA